MRLFDRSMTLSMPVQGIAGMTEPNIFSCPHPMRGKDRSGSFTITWNDIDHARRNTGLPAQLSQAKRRQWRLLRRLEHERAAGGQGTTDLSTCQAARATPQNDATNDSNGFLQRETDE
jgi:hypothetical protein